MRMEARVGLPGWAGCADRSHPHRLSTARGNCGHVARWEDTGTFCPHWPWSHLSWTPSKAGPKAVAELHSCQHGGRSWSPGTDPAPNRAQLPSATAIAAMLNAGRAPTLAGWIRHGNKEPQSTLGVLLISFPCSPVPAGSPPLSLPQSSSEGQHQCSPTPWGAGIGAVLVPHGDCCEPLAQYRQILPAPIQLQTLGMP